MSVLCVRLDSPSARLFRGGGCWPTNCNTPISGDPQLSPPHAAWYLDETLLAVISSPSHKFSVWGLTGGNPPQLSHLMDVRDTWRRPQAVTFSPTRPGLLAFCEPSRHIYLMGAPSLSPYPPLLTPRSACECWECSTKPIQVACGVFGPMALVGSAWWQELEQGDITLLGAWQMSHVGGAIR